MKKFSTFLCMVLCSIALHANVLTGTCGDNLIWSYDTDTKALTIEGSGAMTDYEYDNQPWAQVSSDILSVSLPEGLTTIGNYAFRGSSSLPSITLPNSVTSIGEYAFAGCTSLPVEDNLRYADTYLVGAVDKSLSTYTIKEGTKWIGNRAFSSCTSLTSITIPNSVTSIEDLAFHHCFVLTSVSLGNSVTSIGERAFHYCSSLTSIILPNSVTSIGERAFSNCSSLTSITLPNSVTSIGNRAFYLCSALTSITIGNSVTSIGGSAFYGCSSLTSITLPNSVTSIGQSAFEGCSSLTSLTLPDSVTSIGNYAFRYCSSLTSITIPNSVTSIGKSAFYNVPNIVYSGTATGSPWGARSVNGYVDGYLVYADETKTTLLACSAAATGKITIPNSVTTIGDYAFYNCSSLTSIILPNSVTSIGEWAFEYCSSLTSIILPNSITSIGNGAFQGCSSLTSINIPNSVTSIGLYAFQGCSSLTSINIPNSVTTIWYDAFSGCSSLTSINIPNSVTTIGDDAFYEVPNIVYSGTATGSPWGARSVNGYVEDYLVYADETKTTLLACSAAATGEVTLPNSVTSIGNNAFDGCSSLTSITLPNSVTSIGGSAFYGCSALTSVTLGDSVTSIGYSAFNGCSSLTSITLPNSVTSIGSSAFMDCSSLTKTNYTGDIASWCNIQFTNYTANPISFSKNLYLSDVLVTDLVIPQGVIGVGDYAFDNCSSLTSITIPNSVTSIGGSAFSGCSSLTSITIPNSVTSIGDGAFSSCAQVTVECTTPPTIESNTFKSDASIFVPCTALDTYLQTAVWQFLDLKGLSHTINLSATKGGKATITATNCDAGTATIEAVADNLYLFSQWSDGNTDNPRTLTLSQDTTLVAHFAEKHQVHVLVGVESACKNMGTVNGNGIFYQGDVVTITATPNEDYHFVEWSDNGDSHATRDILLTSDTTLFATFAAGDMGGKCGDNLYWTWDNGALTITGTGKMDLKHHPAWRQYDEIQITSVSMPEGMTSISSNAFEGYSIATIIVPASVDTVGNSAFANNNQLTHFEYQGNNIQWKYKDREYYRPLYGCGNLQYFRGNIVLGAYYSADTIIVSNGYAFDDMYSAPYVDNTNATDEELWGYSTNAEVKTIETLYLPAGLVEIGDYALHNARFLGGITFPEGVTRIGISAFEDCRSMDSVVFAGNNVEEIGAWAFYNCHSLRSLTLPEGVEEVGLAAFYGCTYLKELTLPSTMKKIADNGFAGCEKMQTMYVNALVPPTIEAKTFEDVDRATPVFVPKGTLERYQADEYWSEFFNMAEYEAPTGNLNTAAEDNGLRKVVRDGQVLIIRGDKTYTILGETIQ